MGSLGYWLPATRSTSILSSEGCGSPFSVRFCDSQVNVLSSTFVSTFSAVERLPSGKTGGATTQPSVPGGGQNRLPKAAIAVENPRSDLLFDRIPANNFPAVGL